MAVRYLLSEEDRAALGASFVVTLENAYTPLIANQIGDIEVALVSVDEIRAVNAELRGIDEATDVLSFPTFPTLQDINSTVMPELLLGSILICPDKAELYGETLLELLHHGTLHILGFDHEIDQELWDETETTILSQPEISALTLRSRRELALL